jgi:hypothetical protein
MIPAPVPVSAMDEKTRTHYDKGKPMAETGKVDVMTGDAPETC